MNRLFKALVSGTAPAFLVTGGSGRRWGCRYSVNRGFTAIHATRHRPRQTVRRR